MPCAFQVLYDLALQIRLDPALRPLTRHAATQAPVVEAELRLAILRDVMPGEAALTPWQRLRVFCLNLVNRSQPPLPAADVLALLNQIQSTHANDEDRIRALAAMTGDDLPGQRPREFFAAVRRVASPQPVPALGQRTYLAWIDQRWLHWIAQPTHALDVDALLADLDVLSVHPATKITGMGLPLAANFMADIGVSAFAKPDLHVMPIISLLQLSIERKDEEREAFRGLVRIARADHEALGQEGRFAWLQEAGGLRPRHLDRLIYLVGSDNFHLDGQRNKRQAPARRALMRQALICAGLVAGRYA
ncbi:MAG: hypothetical protein RI884_1470 [Pseudomonadota bacterium]|jgi:hypothetical protein